MSTEGRLFADKYRILDQIAQGDLASVYQATDVESGEICTLRLFNWEFSSDGSFLDLLKQEALNVEKLRHPNVMPVGMIDQTRKGQIYAVREFIEGRNLEDVMRLEAPLSLRRACMIGRQIASALEAAHNAGIIHGDLKPANVLLLEEKSGMEAVKVLGFGTFALKQDRFMDLAHLALHEPAGLIGSAQYISPERAIGTEPEALDGRSDIYSLGVILYEMLSGEVPFRGSSAMEILLDHLFDEPHPFREHSDLEIPEVLDALVMRTLAKQRKDRPSSATVLVDQLQPWQKEDSTSQPLIGAPARDEDVIIAGTRPALEPAPISRSPIAYGAKPEVDESAPTLSLPFIANAEKAPERGNAERGSLSSSSLSPSSESKDEPGSSPPVQPANPEPSAAENLKGESLPASGPSDTEEQPVSGPSFPFLRESQPEASAPTIQASFQDTTPKTDKPEEAQPDSFWSSFPAGAPEPKPAPGVDFRAAAGNAGFSSAGGAQADVFWSSKEGVKWDGKNPAVEFPSATAPTSQVVDQAIEPSSFTPDLDQRRPEASAQIAQEPIAEEIDVSASNVPERRPTDTSVFLAELRAQLAIESASKPTTRIPDISLGQMNHSRSAASPQIHASKENLISDLSAPAIGALPAAEKPRHSHSVLAATVLVILIAAGTGSGWLYYTGRSYWFQPQYVISRVSSLLWTQSSPPGSPSHPGPAQVSPPASAHQPSSAEALPPTSSAVSPPAATATPHPHGAARSTGAPPNNSPIQALKVPGPSEAVKRLPLSPTRAKVRRPQPTSEDSPAVEDAIRRGNYYFLLGKYDDAIRVYDAALKQSPGNPRLLDEIARARRAKAAEAEFLGH
jgi:eukaryotic-like serine/threonine-protein kinase